MWDKIFNKTLIYSCENIGKISVGCKYRKEQKPQEILKLSPLQRR